MFAPSNDGTGFVEAGTLRITSVLNQNDRAEFRTVDENGNFRFLQGQQVEFRDATDTVIFAGLVQRAVDSITPGSASLRSRVSCVDFTDLLERRFVAEVYEGIPVHVMIEDILSRYHGDDGITTSVGAIGVRPTKVVFDHQSTRACLDRLASLTGYHWRIDYAKVVHFEPRHTNTAPFSIGTDSGNWRDLSVERNLDEYRNRQLLRAGTDVTAVRTETFVGDGVTRTFPLAFPCASAPTITLGGGAQTVTASGLGVAQWYWSEGSNEISQDASQGAPGVGTLVAVTYRGLFPILVQVDDPSEIEERALVQGDDGVFESVEVDASVNGTDLATDRANGLLRQFGRITHKVVFETDTLIEPTAATLAPGQLLTVALPELGATGQYLVESVELSDVALSWFRLRVTALSGEAFGGWASYYRRLAAQSRDQLASRENELLLRGVSRTHTVGLTDSVDAFDFTPIVGEVGSTSVNFCEVG